MIIYGKNPVEEILCNPESNVEEVLIAKAGKRERISDIITLAKERGIKVSFLSRDILSRISDTSDHQGVAARVSDFRYSDLSRILEKVERTGEKLLLVILDHIQDPQNLGAIIRTSNVLGAHGVVIPKDRASPVTAAVVKTSSGAASFVPVARVTNLASVIRELKEKDIWIVGADQTAGRALFEEDFYGLNLAIVIGSEGKGISRLVSEECDFLVSIPRAGEISSLNASVAAGIMLYEIVRQRSST